jgi:hypothetical protein
LNKFIALFSREMEVKMKQRLFIFIGAFVLLICLFTMKTPALAGSEPSAPEPPYISNLRLLKTDSGVPYFCLEVHIPQSVMWLNMAQDVSGWVELETEGMVDSMGWGSSAGGSGRLDVFTNNPVPCEPGSFYLYFEIPEKDMTEADVSERCYRYRLRFKYVYSDGQGALQTLTSEWSNQLCNQSESYLGASAWAVPELDMAAEYGLITNAVRGNMAGDITRGEFAEIAVRLYEQCGGKAAGAGDRAFADTSDPQVLKAYNLGIVEGVGENRYAPDKIINRVQMAKIIYNTLKKLLPDIGPTEGDLLPFADEDVIGQWARDYVYFCSEASLINGYQEGDLRLFKPLDTASRQSAVIVCKRVYEYYMEYGS